jgi:hypothetical protein
LGPTEERILQDSQAPEIFGPSGSLNGDPEAWPTAHGHVFEADLPGGGGGPIRSQLIESTGNGCFTVAGFPTASNLDPQGIVVDLRDLSSPMITYPNSSELKNACQ